MLERFGSIHGLDSNAGIQCLCTLNKIEKAWKRIYCTTVEYGSSGTGLIDTLGAISVASFFVPSPMESVSVGSYQIVSRVRRVI